MSKIRYHSLDSLRGIASLQVVISHSLVALPLLGALVYNDPKGMPHDLIFFLTHSPISFLWSDSAAVKVFFVLSGFVLSLPYYTAGKKQPYYPSFFFKRIIRLYLPCLAIILISLLCRSLFYSPNTIEMYGGWVRQMWTLPLNSNVLTDLFLLKGNGTLDYFDRALWTLPPEIKLSLILPFVIYLLQRLNKLWSLLFILIYISVWHALNRIGARDIWSDYPVLYFFTFFIIGSVMCKYRLLITDWINRISSVKYYLFLAGTFFVYTFQYSGFWAPEKLYTILVHLNDYVAAVSAIMLLCIVLSQRAQAIMNTKVLTFLGKISFSLYLIHIVVITVFAYLLHNYFKPEVVVGLAAIACFPLAIVFYHLVEVPSLNFANYCSKAITENRFIRKILSYTFKE